MNYAEALHFVENLTYLMEEKGLTKYRLAKLVPCSPSTIANWLNGIQPRGLMRTRLLEVLNVSEDELFGDRTKKAPTPEGERQSSFAGEVTRFLLSLPKDRLRGILLALGAPEELLSELDQQE